MRFRYQYFNRIRHWSLESFNSDNKSSFNRQNNIQLHTLGKDISLDNIIIQQTICYIRHIASSRYLLLYNFQSNAT